MRTLYRHSGFRRLMTAVLMLGLVLDAPANPTGMTVQSGSATPPTFSGSQMTITTSRSAVLNWQSFNIAAGETTIFNQPSAYSIVVNNIHDANASQIYGSLQANGLVVLMNQNGFYFGPDSFIKTGGLIVSTANCLPPQHSGGAWEFNGPPPLASIINYGRIQVGRNSSLFLIADKIENHGSIEAPGGSIGLAAGQTVLLSDRPDGRGLSMAVTLPSGSVDNQGHLIADGGTIAMNAGVVNQNGFIQANSVKNVNGTIELVAADQLNLGANSQIIASGDGSEGGSAGGNVTLKSGNTFSDSVGSQIDVTGGSQGGNGGNVEISAPNVLSLNSGINAQARAGWTAGKLLLDPDYIILDTSGSGSAGGGTVLSGDNPGTTLDLNVNSAFANLAVSQIILQAVYDITLAPGTSWDLSGTIGANFGGVTSGLLTLEAGRNIIFGDGSKITDANNWSVTLKAGYNFANNTVQPGIGSIYLGDVMRDSSGNPIVDSNGNLTPASGSGSIQMASGYINNGVQLPAIDLIAGQDIQVGSGFVRTTGGGAISAWALKGDVNTGTYDHGYTFNPVSSSSSDPYYVIDATYGVGGISTSGGGDVKITAGGNVTSYLPIGSDSSDAGTGTFATQGSGASGDVTIIAGGNVTGHYAVANGTGTIYAGVKMDANGNPITDTSGNYVLNSVFTGSGPAPSGNAGTTGNSLALSLISGGWTVNAANNIFLQEVRNPNGIFNNAGSATADRSYHYFDYAADAYVNLIAGNSVTLGTGLGVNASEPPRNSGDNLPFIYAPILNIVAGTGGVELTGTYSSQLTKLGELILFPSPQGSLTLFTAGDLTGQYQAQDGSMGIYDLIVSDSGYQQYYKSTVDVFGANDHAATPVHDGSPTPITLNILGNMDDIFFSAPEAAQILVEGDMINSRFQGMNLSSDSSQTVQVQVQESDGSLGTATVQPGLTSINVLGNIVNRGEFTTVNLPVGTQINLSPLFELYVGNDNPLPAGLAGLTAATLAASFSYDKTTGKLTYQNIVLNGQSVNVGVLIDFLEGNYYIVDGKKYTMTIQNFNSDGSLKYNSDGTPSLNHQVSVLDSAEGGSLANTYTALGPVPVGNGSGYILGGGGQFNITAHNIDLGTSGGIQSLGVAYDTLYLLDKRYRPVYDANGQQVEVYPLTKLPDFSGGANISVTVSGNLDMFSTIISTVNGGNININAAGEITAGSDEFSGQGSAPRGIFTTAGGNVTVVANGDINVAGSRIATYDGGNVTVESLDGNIDAGRGGSSTVTVDGWYVDPYVNATTTRNVYQYSPQLPFSGILALTFPDRNSTYPAPVATLGNILVEAPNGNVTATAAGILQIPLNSLKYPDATVTVLAGYELNNNGEPVFALGNKNVVTLALDSTFDLSNQGVLIVDDQGHPISQQVILTQLLDAGGAPVLDAAGNQLYVEELPKKNVVDGGSVITYSQVGNQITINPYRDSAGYPVNVVALDGTSDSQGNKILVYGRNVDVEGSGLVASNVKLLATGNINGLIFARNNLDVSSKATVDITALAGGNASVSGPTIIGMISAVGGENITGDSVTANLISANVSGATSGQSGLGQGNAASATSQSMQSDNVAKAADASDDQGDEKKKNGKAAATVQKAGRVTVLLPPKHLSQNQTSSNHL